MAMARRSGCQICAVALLACLIISCKSAADGIGQQVEWAKKMTVPAASKIVSQTGLSVGEWSVTASWEIRTDWDKEKYSAWVVSQLGSDFAVIEKVERVLVLAKHSGGDTQELQFHMTPENSKLLVFVTFKAYPD